MYGIGFLFTTILSCVLAQQFNPSLQQQQGQWGQQTQNVNGFNPQRLPGNRPFQGQGQFPFQGSSGNNQGQNSFNQFGGNQLLAQNGQGQQGQFPSQGQNSFNQFGGNQQQQQQQQSSNSNQQGSGSASNNGNQGSTNINQILWNNNQNDYQCVINNCRGQNLQWNPICGTDNLVYDNVAIMRCAQQCGRRISFSYAGTCVITTTPASRKR